MSVGREINNVVRRGGRLNERMRWLVRKSCQVCCINKVVYFGKGEERSDEQRGCEGSEGKTFRIHARGVS